jgi:hypothetical protein
VRTAALTLAVLAVSAAAAPAVDSPYQSSSYTLSQTRVARPTGEHFQFDYVNPDDPEAKPPAVKQVVTILPRGAHYDASVPGSCTATDDELMLQGADACPADSAVGGGVITVDTGAPGPARIVTADAQFFNNAEDPEGEFIYLNTVRDTGARTVVRADVTRRRTITTAPLLPGTPPDGGSIDTVDVQVTKVVRAVDGERRSYITTPARCTRSRTWFARVRFTYDGDYSQVVATPNACKRPRAGTAR